MLKLKNILNMYALLILVQLFSITERVDASKKCFVAVDFPNNSLPHPSYKEAIENIVDNDPLSLSEILINDDYVHGKVVIQQLPGGQVVGYASTNGKEIVTLAAKESFNSNDISQIIKAIIWKRKTEGKTINRMDFPFTNQRLGKGLQRAGFVYQDEPDVDFMQIAINKQASKIKLTRRYSF